MFLAQIRYRQFVVTNSWLQTLLQSGSLFHQVPSSFGRLELSCFVFQSFTAFWNQKSLGWCCWSVNSENIWSVSTFGNSGNSEAWNPFTPSLKESQFSGCLGGLEVAKILFPMNLCHSWSLSSQKNNKNLSCSWTYQMNLWMIFESIQE